MELWARRWYQEELVETLPESLDYAQVGKERLSYIEWLLLVLRLGRDGTNPELQSRLARNLRQTYLATLAVYRSHNERWKRGWEVPEWQVVDDISARKLDRVRSEVASWSSDGWFASDVKDLTRTITKLVAFSDVHPPLRRSERRDRNSIVFLLNWERDKVRHAIESLEA